MQRDRFIWWKTRDGGIDSCLVDINFMCDKVFFVRFLEGRVYYLRNIEFLFSFFFYYFETQRHFVDRRREYIIIR